MAPLLVVLAACRPGSGFDDKPEAPTSDTDTDTDTDSDTDTDTDSDTDSDTDTDTTGFSGATGTSAETGTIYIPPLGEAVFNEVLSDPPAGPAGDANCDGSRDVTDDEFVELVALGTTTLDLEGSRLSLPGGNIVHVFPAGTFLQPGQAIVVFGGGTPTFDGSNPAGWCGVLPADVVVQVSSTGDLQLDGAGGQTVALVDRYARLVTEVDLDASAEQGESVNRRPELDPGAPVVHHSDLPGTDELLSPGTLADGRPLSLGPDDTGVGHTAHTAHTGSGVIDLDIPELRQGGATVGAEVSLSGVVTAVGDGGLWVQDPAGGAYSGVFVFLGAGSPFSASRGDQVDVVGVYTEVLGRTTVDLAASSAPALVVGSPAPEPAPEVVAVDDLTADPEPYESVLVEVRDAVVATTVGAVFTVRDAGGSSSLRVDDLLFSWPGAPALGAGDVLDSVVGPLDPRGVATVSPRDQDDLVVTRSLRINEILADPATDLSGDANCDADPDTSADEFVELLNAGTGPVDLGGLTVTDAGALRHLFPAGSWLAAGARMVVFGGGAPDFSGAGIGGTWCAPLPADTVVQTASTGALALANSGDTVTLRSGATVLDTWAYGAEAGADASVNRSPDDSAGAMVVHSTLVGAVNDLSPGRAADAAPPTFSNLVVVDGDPGDFAADTAFATSTAAATTRISWDDTHLYVAVTHPDIAAQAPGTSVVVTTGNGGVLGLGTGVQIGSQEPALGFTGHAAVRWSVDGSGDELWTTSGGPWSSTPAWLGTSGSAVAVDSDTVELAIPWSALDVTFELDLAVWMVGPTDSFAATPAGAFVDGPDPDLAQHFRFYPHLDTAPAVYAPVP